MSARKKRYPQPDPMDYYKKFGECGLTASDGRNDPLDKPALEGVIQIKEGDGDLYACGYLTVPQMRKLSAALVRLADSIARYNKEVVK